MADKGRPARGVETTSILLRIPTALLTQIDHVKSRLETERGGFRINRSDLLIRLLEGGLRTLAQAQPPATPPAPPSATNGTHAQAQESAIAAAVAAPARTRSAAHALPRETLERIADDRTLCEGLSLREFAQRLFDKGIYRATAKKDGTEQPAEAGWLKRQLDKAREEGLL